MARSAASKAELAAAALDAYLQDELRPSAQQAQSRRQATAEEQRARGFTERSAPSQSNRACDRDTDQQLLAGAPLRLPHTDWLHHRLQVTGAVAERDRFRHAAAGAGTIPWQLDLDGAEEDWFHLLASPDHRTLSLVGSRMLAAQLREAVERRHALAVARIGRSQACPLDLHALVPVPPDLLRLGPDHPQALGWLWQHWGTTEALRHVMPQQCDKKAMAPATSAREGSFQLTFWAADWTPWRALKRVRTDWPALSFDVQPNYAVP